MKKIIILFMLATVSVLCFAETIRLKSGKTIDAPIIERNDDHVKVDIAGIPITYYLDDIESIDGVANSVNRDQASLQADPRLAEKYGKRGELYFRQRQYDQALSDFNKAIELDPNLAVVYYMRGLTYVIFSASDRRIPGYIKKLSEANGNIAVLEGDIAKAFSDFNKAIELDPNGGFGYQGRGSAYMELEQYEKAKNDFQRAKELFQKQKNTPALMELEAMLKILQTKQQQEKAPDLTEIEHLLMN